MNNPIKNQNLLQQYEEKIKELQSTIASKIFWNLLANHKRSPEEQKELDDALIALCDYQRKREVLRLQIQE